ncbi:hypothetical protein KY285_013130 [Solanum tuberosum]|nr:hypothetical protein KY285_013130 [Solanum tuberosum]
MEILKSLLKIREKVDSCVWESTIGANSEFGQPRFAAGFMGKKTLVQGWGRFGRRWIFGVDVVMLFGIVDIL